MPMRVARSKIGCVHCEEVLYAEETIFRRLSAVEMRLMDMVVWPCRAISTFAPMTFCAKAILRNTFRAKTPVEK